MEDLPKVPKTAVLQKFFPQESLEAGYEYFA